MRLIFVILCTALVGSEQTWGDSTPIQLMRFSPWMRILEKPMTCYGDAEEMANRLLENDQVQNAINQLQGLARIYSFLDGEFFNRMRKDLRDLLGALEDCETSERDLKNYNAASGELKGDLLKHKMEEAHRDLVALLKTAWAQKKREKSNFEKIRGTLNEFNWPSYEDDKKAILKQLSDQLEHLRTTKYDVSAIKKEHGLDDFRREMKLFLQETRLLNGSIQFKEGSTCTASEPWILPNNEIDKNPCKLSKCLWVEMADDNQHLGQLKHSAENMIAKSKDPKSNRVPGKIEQEIQAVYHRLKSSGLFETLGYEIKSCFP